MSGPIKARLLHRAWRQYLGSRICLNMYVDFPVIKKSITFFRIDKLHVE